MRSSNTLTPLETAGEAAAPVDGLVNGNVDGGGAGQIDGASIAASDATTEVGEAAVDSAPVDIDGRRAQQLLERASAMAGRGELGAAVLATRQSLALAPGHAQAHLILGDLLERSNDFGGANAAYQKALQLEPSHPVAAQKVRQLGARLEQSRGAAQQFQFNDSELYSNAESASALETLDDNALPTLAPIADAPSAQLAELPAARTEAPASVAMAAPLAAEPTAIVDEENDAAMPAIEARLPPSRASMEAAMAMAQANVGASAIEIAPVAAASVPAERQSQAARRETTSAPVAPKAAASVSSAPADISEAIAPAVAALGAPTIAPVGASATSRRQVDRRQVNVPVAHERRRTPSRRASVGAPIGAPVANASRASDAAFNVPLTLDVPVVAPVPLWKRVAAQPSFYARTLPLVGVALLSLGFLGWARGRAVSQDVASSALVSSAPGAENVPVQDPNAAPANVGVASDDGASGANVPGTPRTDAAGFPISNDPQTFAAPSTQTAPENGANGAAPTNANGAGRASNVARAPRVARAPGRAVPNLPPPVFPEVSLAPAPIPPANVPSSGGNSANNGGNASGSGGGNAIGGGGLGLPRPQVDLPGDGAARTRILPGDNALNPAGSPNNGYIRVTEGRLGNGVMPTQPDGAARQNERNASEAARGGQTEQAIAQLSQAIRADSDNAGYRYQQRATLFLQRGDYSRASDDFQSAVAAYQNQIARGDNVTEAKRGLAAARSGLTLAIAAKRGG